MTLRSLKMRALNLGSAAGSVRICCVGLAPSGWGGCGGADGVRGEGSHKELDASSVTFWEDGLLMNISFRVVCDERNSKQ